MRIAGWAVCVGLATAALPAAAWGQQTAVQLRVGAATVAQFARIELAIDGLGNYANPFDPTEADVMVEVRGPGSLTVTLPAFWTQEYERQQRGHGGGQAEWLYPTGQPGWRARYAPPQPGAYTCTAVVRDRHGERRSNAATFTCTPSPGRGGYVRVAKADPRFFELDDGSPFFAIGQNVAFVRDSYDTGRMLGKMGSHGANFARIWTCCEDWAMAIEAPKSAWGRSWGGDAPIVATAGREGYVTGSRCARIDAGKQVELQPTRPIALRAATRYVVSGLARTSEGASLTVAMLGAAQGAPITGAKEWTPFRREFSTPQDGWWLEGMSLRGTGAGQALVRGLSVREAAGGPELLEEADLDRPVTGVYNLADCCMLDQVVEAAEKAGVRLQLCLLTRDLYMDRLRKPGSPAYARATEDARRLLRYAAARWGCSPAVAAWEYFNEIDPGVPTENFYADLAAYMAKVDPYHHLLDTSDWADCPRDWRSPSMGIANMHWYMRPAEGERFRDEVPAVLERARTLRKEAPGRPAIFAEFGLAKDDWMRSPYLDQDTGYVHLHNALWASALSGLSSTVMPWWWEDFDKQDAYRQYDGVAAFMKGVPVNRGGLHEARATPADARWRAVGLQGPDRAYLWLCDSRASWWRQVVDKQAPETARGITITLEGLAPGEYAVTWVKTSDGSAVASTRARVSSAPLRLQAPPFAGDIAVRIVKP